MVAAAAYYLATYTINTSLWVSLTFYLVNLILLKFLKKLGKNVTFNLCFSTLARFFSGF